MSSSSNSTSSLKAGWEKDKSRESKAAASSLNGFPPAGALGEPEPRFLVLGSFPSVLSLGKGEYYGNPRNHFWTIVAVSFGLPEPRGYDEKIAMLVSARIALWDLFASCEREGSLDVDISGAAPNPIADFLRRHSSIEAIGVNGGAAAAGFAAEFAFPKGERLAKTGDRRLWYPEFAPGRRITVVRLPSTSPVPTAAFKVAADKMELWKRFFTIHM